MFHMSVSLNSSQKSESCNCLYQFRQWAFYFKVWSFGFIVWSVFFIVGTLNSSHLLVVAVCTNEIRLCLRVIACNSGTQMRVRDSSATRISLLIKKRDLSVCLSVCLSVRYYVSPCVDVSR